MDNAPRSSAAQIVEIKGHAENPCRSCRPEGTSSGRADHQGSKSSALAVANGAPPFAWRARLA
jgi:hypothetical protein